MELDWLFTPDTLLAFITLTILEIVLGIDNIIFISIMSSRLPHHLQPKGRRYGLMLAMVTRLLLLVSLAYLAHLSKPLFVAFGRAVSARDLILIAGGLFLIYKSTHEIHEKVEGNDEHAVDESKKGQVSLSKVIINIAILDIVFSIDSVITAVGIVDHVSIMMAAIVLAVIIMIIAAEPISAFIEEHPSIKMLALSFLLMIGVALVADGTGHEVPKGYIYFSMFFSGLVEMLNIRTNAHGSQPVALRQAPRLAQATPDIADEEEPSL